MASENVDNWDEPLPSSSVECEDEETPADERRRLNNLDKLHEYVQKMAYRPVPPKPSRRPRLDQMAQPKQTIVMDTYELYGNMLQPKERRKRMKRMTGKYTAITTEQLEQIVRSKQTKESKKQEILKKKQEIYYEMLTKLEHQCRTQYLNLIIKKFASFIAKLATTMRIPPQLVEPYSRMQRGIFCNILLALGVQPKNQMAIYYTTKEALEYEVCHKLAHAILSLIIKALDSASVKNPEEIQSLETDFEMDNYIRDRLMNAAERKILNSRAIKKLETDEKLAATLRKCDL